MNEELAKMRELRGYNEAINTSIKPERLNEDELTDIIVQLNVNMGELFQANFEKNFDEQLFVDRIMDNIIIILDVFNRIHVYPGYFFHKVFEMYSKCVNKKVEETSDKKRVICDYIYFSGSELSAWASGEIRNGIDNGYHHVQAYPKTSISDAFNEISDLYQKNNIARVNTKEQCQRVFNNIFINYINAMEELSTTVLNHVDVECLCRVLYNYIVFFVAIGYNPKEKLDEQIESRYSIIRKK